MKKVLILTALVFLGSTGFAKEASLNRPGYVHKAKFPPLPTQSQNYINIANYNIRSSYLDQETPDSWENRKETFAQTLKTEDEAVQLMEAMSQKLRSSCNNYFTSEISQPRGNSQEDGCLTCRYRQSESYPIFETQHFRIALKANHDEKGRPCANFPYPYRLILALKEHRAVLTSEEWAELGKILTTLEAKVCKDLSADYTSYAVLQDVYHREKRQGEEVAEEPHFFLHFIFRFPEGVEVNGMHFKDPNPGLQFELRHPNYVCENCTKGNSNFIYKRSPDIINTQEMTLEQGLFLKEQLPNHKLIGYTAHDGTPLEQIHPDDWIEEIVAIAYRSDRFELLDRGVRWLSPTPERPSVGFEASRKRIIVWAKFRDKLTHQAFFMFNTHYDHIGKRIAYVNSEANAIKDIAKDAPWFAVGERFYRSYNGDELYRHYLSQLNCFDVRDKAIVGHYGEAGSWGGFSKDPFAVSLQDGALESDTLDVGFSNCKNSVIIFTYTINGAYDPVSHEPYQVDEKLKNNYRLASDHLMTGFYVLMNSLDRETNNK